jgi:hypothetical protein
MIDKTPMDFSWVTYAWVSVLSIWGGAANYVNKLKAGKSRFNLLEIVGEIVVSGFAGVMTFYICRGLRRHCRPHGRPHHRPARELGVPQAGTPP